MTDRTERVARAIYEHRRRIYFYQTPWEDLRPLIKGEWREEARAAIAAMEQDEPTPSPSATELALVEAKEHIGRLTKFFMENPAWIKASENARRWLAGAPLVDAEVDRWIDGICKNEPTAP